MNDYMVESNGMLVFRYIGDMRQQFQDVLNFFDPLNVSKPTKGPCILRQRFLGDH